MTAQTVVAYRERLHLAWWMWPGALALAALAGASVHSGYPGVRSWLPYVLFELAAVALLVRLSRTTIRIGDGHLVVAGSRLPLAVVAAVRVLDRQHLGQFNRGGRLPDGFHVVRGWIDAAVQVRVDDPADCTPYWLLSSRHPEQLADALAAERARILGLSVD